MGLFGIGKKRDLDRREREFLDIIAHELRTPISIVKVSFGLLKEKLGASAEKDTEQYVSRIDEAIYRTERILESMLSSTKIEQGRLEMHLESADIVSTIRNSIVSVEKEAKEKGLEIILDIPMNELLVYTDKVRTQEIVDNFLTNAVKYTRKGSVTVKIEEADGQGRVTVSDTGVGMSEEDISRLGEKFFRAEQGVSQEDLVKPGGTGLGLYIAFNLISLLGGSVDVQSEMGKGSSFSFTLPLYVDQPEKDVKNDEEKDLFRRMGFTQTQS